MRRSASPLHVALPVALIGLLGGLLAACGPPPTPASPPPQPAPAPPSGAPLPATAPPVPTDPIPPPTGASPAGFPNDRAVGCGGEPGGDAVLALLRREEVLPRAAEATVAEGPLCAGTWQYAVISVPGHDPLQVVTRGDPDALELVTAGTEVCIVEVRVQAPSGIRAAADCAG